MILNELLLFSRKTRVSVPSEDADITQIKKLSKSIVGSSAAKTGALSDAAGQLSAEQAEQQQTGKQDVIRASDFNFLMVLGKGE